MASVAQYEVEQLGERVSETFRDVQELGWHKGGKTAWGYRLRDATEGERKAGSPKKVLDVDGAAAPHVRETFRRAAEGETLRSLARWAAGLPAEARAYKALSYAAIRNVLKSPTYIARQPWGDEDVLARSICRWPALVDDATWLQVQERIGAHARMPRQASGRHLLTGLIRCPAPGCGARMGGESALVRNGKVVYAARYRCKGHLYGAGHADRRCTAAAHMRAVDQAVIADVTRVLAAYAAVGDRAFMAELRRAWHELQAPPETADVARRVRQREAEVAKAQQRLQALTYKLIDQAIDDETYRTMKTDIERTRDAARAELQRLRGARARPALPLLDHVLGRIGGWEEALGKFDVAHQREILGELIERVVPIRTSRQRGRGTPYGHEVKIDWTDQGEALRKIAGISTPVPA
jgi:hypothetical protein